MYGLRSPVAVTAHDAGAANFILGWLRDCENMDVRCCVDGPAQTLFSEYLVERGSVPLANALNGAQILLSGTSRVSTLEHDSRILARSLGVRSIGVIDHWVNYRERFIRQDQFVLPDELWVSDGYALLEAKKYFPDTPVIQRPNRYLEQLTKEIGQVSIKHHERTRILYALEPIRSKWGRNDISGEFQSLEYFISRIPTLINGHGVEIRLRPHPSDALHKYDQWLAVNRNYDISIDTTLSLASAIAWSDWVVGCETYAMVVALNAGKRVFSSLPPDGPTCRLPFPGIIHLATT